MPIKNYSTTAANNNAAPPNGFPEGMAPSDVNNSARTVMADIRSWYEDAQWIDYGNVPTYVSTNSFSVIGNQTAIYTVGRRIKLSDASTLYGTISASVFTTLTTVTVTMDSGSLSIALNAVALGIITPSNNALPATVIAGLVPYTAPTTTVGASIALAEGTTNGTNTASLKAADNLAANITSVLPSTSGTLANKDNEVFNSAGFNTAILGDPLPKVAQGRLTLTSNTPVTTSDVIGATTIYYTPYVGNCFAHYTGFAWVTIPFTQLSLSLSGLTANRPYDVFVNYNSGSPQLVVLAWASDTASATALVYQDGVLLRSGTLTHRYVGTFYATGATTAEDSVANRYVWNMYNRCARPMLRRDATASWTYSTAAFRQANGSTANQLNFVIGVVEDSVKAFVSGAFSNGDGVNRTSYLGIGLNSTTTNSGVSSQGATNNIYMGITGLNSSACIFPSLGRNYLAWLEFGAGASTQTWQGGASLSGITGELFA
jgi:hypothetical protein